MWARFARLWGFGSRCGDVPHIKKQPSVGYRLTRSSQSEILVCYPQETYERTERTPSEGGRGVSESGPAFGGRPPPRG